MILVWVHISLHVWTLWYLFLERLALATSWIPFGSSTIFCTHVNTAGGESVGRTTSAGLYTTATSGPIAFCRNNTCVCTHISILVIIIKYKLIIIMFYFINLKLLFKTSVSLFMHLLDMFHKIVSFMAHGFHCNSRWTSLKDTLLYSKSQTDDTDWKQLIINSERLFSYNIAQWQYLSIKPANKSTSCSVIE